MATVLDLGLLEFFRPLITIVLVATLAYGIFSVTKVFGENKGLHAIVAVLIALILAIIPSLTNLLSTMLPWFIVFFIFVVFLLMGFKLFGATDSDLANALRGNRAVMYWIITIAIIIFLGSVGTVFFAPSENGQRQAGNLSLIQPGEIGTTGEPAFWATIVHPKVLGMIIMLLIAVFTILTLAGGGPAHGGKN